jgi:hypothetical protein
LLGPLHSWIFQFSNGSRLKVQICPGGLICPEIDFQQHPQVVVIITSSMFIRFECLSNEWKVQKVSYEFAIESFLRLCWILSQKSKFLSLFNSVSTEMQQSGQFQNYITPKPFIVLRCANNCCKEEKVFYNYGIGLQVRFQPCRCRFDIF